MAQPRVELQALLESVLGSSDVYFQPSQNVAMNFPCIVYERTSVRVRRANNQIYDHKKRYQITSIGRDPDSSVPEALMYLPYCAFDRHFTANNLHHDVFTIFF